MGEGGAEAERVRDSAPQRRRLSGVAGGGAGGGGGGGGRDGCGRRAVGPSVASRPGARDTQDAPASAPLRRSRRPLPPPRLRVCLRASEPLSSAPPSLSRTCRHLCRSTRPFSRRASSAARGPWLFPSGPLEAGRYVSRGRGCRLVGGPPPLSRAAWDVGSEFNHPFPSVAPHLYPPRPEPLPQVSRLQLPSCTPSSCPHPPPLTTFSPTQKLNPPGPSSVRRLLRPILSHHGFRGKDQMRHPR